MERVTVKFLVKNEAHCAAESDVRTMDIATAKHFEGFGWVKILPEKAEAKTEKAPK